MKAPFYGILFCLVACNNQAGNHVPPEQSAKKFVSQLQLELQGEPVCTTIDSDGDGYVSCTVALKSKEGAPIQTMAIQCAGLTADGCAARYTEGCKQSVPSVRPQT